MEASDTAGQPPVEPGQSDAVGGEQPEQPQDQSQGEQPTSSQEQSAADSNLTTDQPDQPVQPEVERQQTDDSQVSQPDVVGGSTVSPGPSGEAAEGTVSPPQYPTGAQQTQAAVDQEQAREEQRREHNERTGGGEVQSNEVQRARQEHNDRTGGGQVPGVEPQASQPADGSG